MTNIHELAAGIKANNRRSISKALTLIESELPTDSALAIELLGMLHSPVNHCRRVAISGTPGVGKSSFIEMIGCHLVAEGKKIAVLAIDPTSPITGGSILGDKTRMEQLSISDKAFIRPSPSKGVLGGVARATREACAIFTAAGYDYIFIETVGVGQSETLAHLLVDCFVMLHLPNSGDELQGIKKGITELADLIVIHKADKDNQARARAAKSEFIHATHYYNKSTPIILASSVEKTGAEEFLSEIDKFFGSTNPANSKKISKRRAEHNIAWLKEELKFLFIHELTVNKSLAIALKTAEDEVRTEKKSVEAAAADLFKSFLGKKS